MDKWPKILKNYIERKINVFKFYDNYIYFDKKINKIIATTFILTFCLTVLYSFLDLIILEPLNEILKQPETSNYLLLSNKLSNPHLKSFFSFYECIILPISTVLSVSCLFFMFKVKNKGVWLLNKIIQFDINQILKQHCLKIKDKKYCFSENYTNTDIIDITTQKPAILNLSKIQELIQYFYPLMIYFYLKETFKHMNHNYAMDYLNFKTINQELEINYLSSDNQAERIEKIFKKYNSLEKIEQDFVQNCFSCLNLDSVLFQALVNNTDTYYTFSQFEFIYEIKRHHFIDNYQSLLNNTQNTQQYGIINLDLLKWLFEHATEDEKIYQFLKDPKIDFYGQCFYYYEEHIAIIDEKIRLNKILKDPEKENKPIRKIRKI